MPSLGAFPSWFPGQCGCSISLSAFACVMPVLGTLWPMTISDSDWLLMKFTGLNQFFDLKNREDLRRIRRPLTVFGLLSLLLLLGTVGFRLIGHVNWVESLYLAVVTLTTLGSRDPASDTATMVFTIIYMMFGLGLFSYSITALGKSLIDARYRILWRRRQMLNRIRALQDHYIVCGQGRMGTTICEYLARRNKPFVVIDHNEEQINELVEQHDWLCLAGDATDDAILRQAGIERAKSLASTLGSDADNVYVVLSARMLNNNLQIVARASDDKAIEKMERAGATRVISPFSSGATKMARFMLNPLVDNFVEVADEHDSDLELIDFQVTKSCPYLGKKLSETDMRDSGVIVLGIRRENGERLIPPPGSAVLLEGDSLFVFGHAASVGRIFNLGEASV